MWIFGAKRKKQSRIAVFRGKQLKKLSRQGAKTQSKDERK